MSTSDSSDALLAEESFLKNFIAGGISGAAVKTIAAPIERIKLLLQTQAMNSQIVQSQRYTSPVDCIRRVYRDQGLLSFWRGNTATVARYIPNQAFNFSLKDRFKVIFSSLGGAGNIQILFINLLSSGCAGASSLAICHPLDMARTRMAADVGTGSTRRYTGLINCIKIVLQTSGIRGVYRGFAVSLVGAIVFRALYMGGYDSFKSILSLENSSILKKYLVAQIVTTAVGTACYPIDTVKRRMMIQGLDKFGELHIISGRACLARIYSTEGFKGFYSGLSVNLVRGIGGALLLVGYDEAKKLADSF